MKIFTILLASIIIGVGAPGIANAGPFLVCDAPNPAEQVVSYEVYQDGALMAATNDMDADGSLRFDLAGTPPGQYEFTAKACNVWGCSDLSNPTQSPPNASVPSGVSLVAE